MRRAHERRSSGDQRHRGRPVRITTAIALAITVAAIAAQSAPAAAGFERGDVLASVGDPSAIARFAADGTAKGTLAGSAGAGPLCFDPSGKHLIAPGAGLYGDAGNLLPSDWKTLASPGACTVDGTGNVFLAGGPYSGDTPATRRATIRRFDLTGHLLQSYDVDATGRTYGRAVGSVDLAPDDCTIYYVLGGSDEIKRYDVCTDTQKDPFADPGPVCDGLRVRPNGQVVVTCDTYGSLFDSSGVWAHDFDNPTLYNSLRSVALDPDGSSLWMGEYHGVVARYDIASGQKLGSWSAGSGLHGLAVYSPPAPPQPNTETSLDPGTGTQSGASIVDAATAGHTTAVAAPALVIARSRLITSGRSLLLDTGLRATCPAGGLRCRATVALTMAAHGHARPGRRRRASAP
jgi:WD40 repeat protein